jgi:hypothetical protein
MAQYGKITTASGGEVLFEIEGPSAGRVATDKLKSSFEERFDSIMEIVKESAENVYLGLQNIEKRSQPNEYTIKFGLKLGLGSNLIFANANSEGTFEVTLKWIRPE